MSQQFLSINPISTNSNTRIKQDLKFKTGSFVWRVKFNTPLDPKTVNNSNLYVTTVNQTPLKTAIRYNSIENEIEIEPTEPYSENEAYVLNITKNVKSTGGKALKSPIQIQFKLDK